MPPPYRPNFVNTLSLLFLCFWKFICHGLQKPAQIFTVIDIIYQNHLFCAFVGDLIWGIRHHLFCCFCGLYKQSVIINPANDLALITEQLSRIKRNFSEKDLLKNPAILIIVRITGFFVLFVIVFGFVSPAYLFSFFLHHRYDRQR